MMTIVVTTWLPENPEDEQARRNSVREAVESWRYRLRYEDGEVNLHIADDGTRAADYPLEFPSFTLWNRGGIAYTQQDRHGVGASLNAGFAAAFEQTDVVAYLVDDWALAEPFDITPWVRLLREDETMGMVRLGPPHPWLTGEVEHIDERWVLRLEPHHYAFAHQPAVYHKRFWEAHGPFAEDQSAWECERLYAEQWAARVGQSDIVLALPYPWRHTGDAVELGEIEP